MLHARVSESPAKSRRPPKRSMVEKRRFDGRSPEAWRIKQLEKQYRIELGEVSAIPAVMQAIRRAAELTMLSEIKRASMIRGEAVNVSDLLRLEGVMRRSLDHMRLLATQARDEAQSEQAYDQFFAFTRTGRVEPREPHEAAGRGGATPSPRHAPGDRRRARQRASCDDEEG